jgi:hypothetical protein
MPSYTPSNIPGDTTLLDFRATVDNLGAPAKNCRFAIQILPAGPNNFLTALGYTGILRDLQYLCEAAELPGRGFEYMEGRYYGPSFMLPYNTKYTNEFSVSIITRQSAYERQMFDDWLEVINPTNSFDLNYSDNYYCTIKVFQLSEFPSDAQVKAAGGQMPTKAQASYLWELRDAWPFQVNPQPVTWADNDVLRLNVTFAYRYWRRPGRDSEASGTTLI